MKGEKVVKISGVYKITNAITGDFYIGSSKDVKERWAAHKWPSTWKKCPNNPMYQDMRKYGVDKFAFEILAEVEIEKLKEIEQKFIETLNPIYNSCNAKGLNIERCKETKKEYLKEYNKSDKYKEAKKEYNNQLCCYNGETLTLCALKARFMRRGFANPTAEAKKYLIKDYSISPSLQK